MYCNSCMKKIPKDEITYCKSCGVPLCKSCANHCLECGAELCDDCYSDNHFRCDSCIDANKEIKTVRRSYLKQYEDCPYSLYLQMMEGITPPMGSYAELGILTHELLEDIQNDKVTFPEAKIMLHNAVEDWNSQTEDEYSIIPLTLLETGLNCIDNFELLLPMLQADEFKTEHRIEFSIDEKLPTINCTVDRIAWKNGEIYIHDWKTGKPMAGKKLAEDLQPPIYIYGVYKEFGVMPKAFTLHYLNNNKNLTYRHIEDWIYEVSTSRKSYRINVLDAIERSRNILSNIKKHNFSIIEDKEHLWRCSKMCWYHMSGVCKDNDEAKWKLINKEREKNESNV